MAGVASLCPAEHYRVLSSAFPPFILRDTKVGLGTHRRDKFLGRKKFRGHKKHFSGNQRDT
jgi:hypothetical protein